MKKRTRSTGSNSVSGGLKLRPAEAFPKVMALAVIGIGVTSLFGRAFDSAAIVSILAAPYPLLVNPAICLVCLGIGLWLLCSRDYSRAKRLGVLALSLCVIVIASATAAEHIFHFELGIDGFVFADYPGPNNANAGRMPILAAISLDFFALALLLIDSERARSFTQLAVLVTMAQLVFVIALIAYDAANPGVLGQMWSISLLGCCAEVLLAAGLIAARPNKILLSLLEPNFRQAAAAGLALATLLGATTWYWHESQKNIASLARANFETEVAGLKEQIKERLTTHLVVLAGIGSFMAMDPLHREWDHWRRYVEQLNTASLLPGVLSVGYAPVLHPGSIGNHVLEMQAAGFHGYRIRPDGSGETCVPVSFLEPMSPRSRDVLGFDLFSDATRRSAMLASVRSGLPAISGKLSLLGEHRASAQSRTGFTVYVPLFRPGTKHETPAQRQAALEGFIFSPLRTQDFFSAALQNADSGLGVEIYDGGKIAEHSLLYRSKAGPAASAPLQSETRMDVGNHYWTLRISDYSAASEGAMSEPLPNAILLGGIALSLLVVSLGLALAKVRTHSLKLSNTSEELAHLAGALKDSNAELQRFAYVASHDLRAPIRSIGGFTQILRESAHHKLTEEENSFLARIETSTNHMQEMIETLLQYARIDAKAKEFVRVDLSQICNAALEMLDASITETGARVELEPLPVVMGDSVQLIELVQNLIANALAYRSKAPPRIRISAVRTDSEHIISVQDNGIGIEPADHDKIFEMFKRLRAQDKIPGTGIGLATCRRVVQRHGGRIWLESEAGKGSTFRFALPALPAG